MTAPDEKLTFDLVARDRASREFDKVGDAAVRAGRDFDKAGDGAGQLQMQIDDSTRSLRALGDEFDRTGDRALLKDLSRESRTLRGLQKLRREMSALADATGDVSHFSFRGLTGAIESLPLQLKGALIVAAAGGLFSKFVDPTSVEGSADTEYELPDFRVEYYHQKEIGRAHV